jgi:hypothetical protein
MGDGWLRRDIYGYFYSLFQQSHQPIVTIQPSLDNKLTACKLCLKEKCAMLTLLVDINSIGKAI